MRRSYVNPNPVGGVEPLARPLPPFPKKQMLVLAVCRIAEPIAFMGIFPYIFYMVQDFHIAEDDDTIAIYAGMVTSAFTFAEFMTGYVWGNVSDRIGRKPVLLMGLFGTALSVLMFGFAPNLATALVARALGGLLNGNMGVLQTTVAELVPAKEQRARAFTIMPLVWCIGSIVGPSIGGALARPVKHYPDIFVEGSIWERFPYLLPNLFSAAAVCVGLIVGILFLEETHPERKLKRDRGVEFGKMIVASFKQLFERRRESTKGEEEALLGIDEQLPGYLSADSSPELTSTSAPDLRDSITAATRVSDFPRRPVKVFTRPVILNIICFGVLAFHTMTYDQLLPVFLSMDPLPNGDAEYFNPIKFVGGFGYDNNRIGFIIAVQGIYSMITNAFLFPYLSKRFGTLRLFQFLSTTYFLLYLVTPYLVLLPPNYRMAGVYFMVIWKCTYATMAFPANSLLLSEMAPSFLFLGRINGASGSTASLCRAFGPLISGWLFTFGRQTGYSGLAWWFSGCVSLIGLVISWQLKPAEDREVVDEKDDDCDVESLISLPERAEDE